MRTKSGVARHTNSSKNLDALDAFHKIELAREALTIAIERADQQDDQALSALLDIVAEKLDSSIAEGLRALGGASLYAPENRGPR